ncbi:oligoribonuclease [Parageobacillus sp. VR-IP]|uniref:DHH family phosphoesterase n=1 Tax=Parageobacillus sp. VR-IP TaxID=2742205 RepID=UPI001581CDFC|nr:oligoribonuclease [Parageobacillus sp. VR-IP]NUK30432.1 oligoribonuclease [Parageobacillus sp. VR-IP]
MVKLFTDSDLDGIGCGLLAKLAFAEVNISFCSYRNLDERVRQFLEDEQNREAELFITDLAVGEEVEQKLAERFNAGGHVQVIDHHVTALHFNQYPWGWVKPTDEQGKKTCATSLFYDYLIREGKLERNETLDEFVELVRQYDTWEWEETNNTRAKRLNDLLTILGLDEFWDKMSERLAADGPFSLTETEELILDMEEKKIQRYIRMKQKQLVQRWFGDYCVGIVFAERHLSELGNALSKRCPHLDLIAMVNMGTKHIGFRTIHDTVNVAEFAKQFGGGGHPKASGCFVDETTFPLFVVDTFPLTPVYHDAEQNKLNTKDQTEGFFFTNHQGQWFFFHQAEETWMVCQEGKEKRSFLAQEEAERWIKRQFAAGLADDQSVIDYLHQQLSLEKEKIKEEYVHVLQQYKQKTGIPS